MRTLFISDLHLHESRPQITRAFFEFLRTQARDAEKLYILGDFFDAWIGDDDDNPLHAEVACALKSLNDSGTQIFLMHGNRDFLIGETFAAQAGAQLLAEGSVIDVYGCPSLVLHGDSLCTGDAKYLAFRQQVRNLAWQESILALPLVARRALAAQMRATSQAMNSLKADDILDVAPEAVVACMQAAGVTRLIHGHTHRPAHHRFEVDARACERMVLGDWHHQGWMVSADENSITLISWPID